MTRSKPTQKRGGRAKQAPPQSTWDERLIRQLIPWQREIVGIVVILLAVVTLFGLLGLTESNLLLPWSRLLRQFAGWGAIPLALTAVVIGVFLIMRRTERSIHPYPSQVIGVELLLLAALPLSHILFGGGLMGALDGRGGGLVGWALSEPLIDLIGPLLTILLHLSFLLLGLALIFRIGWNDVVQWLNSASVRLQIWSNELEVDVAERKAQMAAGAQAEGARTAEAPPPPARPARATQGGTDRLIIIDDSASGIAPRSHKRDSRLPKPEVLEEGSVLALTPEEIDEKKLIIEQTLLDFGLPATVTEIRRGPAVTQFGVEPGYIERPGPDGRPHRYKVRVGQIAALQNDLALALAAPRIRIEAPVPGRGIVGVEVPNSETSVVRLRAIAESESFYKLKSTLAVALGRDVAGAPVTTDLATLPHLLIAGTTGSGKSVCLNALIACLAYNNTPERLKLVMIDPKKVELIRFNGMPHLLGKVEIDVERVTGVLRWLTGEMDRRYELFAAINAKHLEDYNRKARRRKELEPLPYIAVFVDELADLMTMYPGDVERTLCRLAQMARATGIHLVVATQRPSTDVITGLIKANFPARASFAVASGVDSRVILDTVGAEQLLGKGDMLFLAPDASAPVRIQGCFVSDREIEAIVNHWQKEAGDHADQEPENAPWEELIARKMFISDRDEMLESAIALAQKNQTISASLIQRRLRVGYPRAARLMEALYEMGLVEDPKEGGRTRRTYVNEDDDPLGDFLSQET
jgi:S-DNA-T family DNA segregation ATPase FtsK/SpoIIIE